MKSVLINQPCGLGDILFTIKIGDHYTRNGFKVIWPVHPTYECVKDKLSTNGIKFYCLQENFPFKETFLNLDSSGISEITDCQDEVTYVPLTKGFQFANSQSIFIENHEKTNMLSKYIMCKLEPSNWQSHFSLKRNHEKENELFSKLSTGKDYHLVNTRFGTPPTWEEHISKTIETPKNLCRLNMELDQDYDIFDWSKVIENANKIDTVATSLPFLFESLDLNCKPTIHSRNKTAPEASENFELMKEIYEKDYHYEA